MSTIAAAARRLVAAGAARSPRVRRALVRAGDIARATVPSAESVATPGSVDGLTYEAFVRANFRRFLERDPDPDGLAFYVGRLRAGWPATELVAQLASSPERIERLLEGRDDPLAPLPGLPDLRAEAPDRYGVEVTRARIRRVVLRAEDDATFDWIERRIRDDGYYERPGVWSLEPNDDMANLADLIASFGPARTLEIGCSSGGVIGLVVARGIDAHGLDVAELARASAPEPMRDRITIGDLTGFRPATPFDLVCGFDVFEHMNPNRLSQALAAVRDLVAPHGVVVANIPYFGWDPVFGKIADDRPLSWPADEGPHLFRTLPCDDGGWPIHGHLANATWSWWTQQFAAAGLSRDHDAERRLDAQFGPTFRSYSPARAAMLVFRKSNP